MNFEEIKECDSKFFMTVYSGRYPAVMDYGKGVRLYDKSGKEYLDFLAGIGVNALGYAHPGLTAAIKEQAEKLIHTSNLYYIEPQAKLEKLLVENTCCDRVFFANSGSEANEGAFKLARKYFYKKGEERYKIITAERSFHGRTLNTTAATGQEKYQKHYRPLPKGYVRVPFNNIDAVADAVDLKTAAVMIEPVQGEGGVYPAEKKFMKELRELCDEKGILLIFDEIQCGLGRTGEFLAYEHYDVEPDILTLAKALGGGVPIGAFMAKEEVASSFEPGDHGTTFGGNHLATGAALFTMKTILEEGFLEKVREIAQYFKEQLKKLSEKLENVVNYRGLGLMLALKLDDSISAGDVTMELFERGFLINAVQEHTLRFLPPLIIEKEDIDKLTAELYNILESE